MTVASDFGSWRAEDSLETPSVPAFAREARINPREQARAQRRSSASQRWPASSTVRVPYLPSHVKIHQLRQEHRQQACPKRPPWKLAPKRRPRSAASSYMRATFAIDSALPLREQQQLRQRHRRRASWQQPEQRRPEEAKYVLQEGPIQGSGSYSRGVSTVPRHRQGFGVRTAAVVAAATTAAKNCTDGRSGWTGGLYEGSNRPDRRPTRRPASAPMRFFGRPPSSPSPGYEREETGAASGGGGPRGACPPHRQATRRPGSALAKRNPAVGSRRRDAPSPSRVREDQQKRGSPLPPAAWGVRTATAPSSSAASPAVKAATSGGVEQAERNYEEVVVCRASHRVIKGSAARRQRGEGLIGGRVGGGGNDGRRDKWVGLLEGSSEALWTCGRGGGGGEDDHDDTDTDDARFLDLAINPSPWGAFVGGPPGMENTPAASGGGGGGGGGGQRQLSKKRPSSAPRQPPTATAPPAGRSEEGDGRTRTRPRSAHAASPSREHVAGTFVTTAYGGGGSGERENEEYRASPRATPGGEAEKLNSARRGSRGGLSVSAAVDGATGRITEGTGGVAAPRQAGGAIFAGGGGGGGGGGGCHPAGVVPDAELVVVARQLQPRAAFSPANKGSRYNGGLEKKASETPAPAFSSRAIASGMLFDTLPPPSLARPMMPRTPAPSPPPPLSPPAPPPPPNEIIHTLGLTGSAIVPGVAAAPAAPAAGGTEPRPSHGTNTRRVFQQWQQQQQQQTAKTLAGWVKEAGGRWRSGENGGGNTTTTTGTAAVRYGVSTIAPSVVLDSRTANSAHESSGRRRARASGLAGKALRVRRPKPLVLGR
ncbi:unnamed protein product [Ectocarpus fasciculatus]